MSVVLPPPGAKTLGRFQLRRLLGKGAQASVWLAYDPRLEREVAVKLLAIDADEADLSEWLDEARAVSRLSHPNIVPVFEADQHQGRPYLVFEFVDGVTLAEALRTRPKPSARAAVETMLGIVEAVAVAHDDGIVHRDLKPSNVLVGKDGRARVMDFGIAARVSGGGDGRIVGTPGYISPEAARGQAPLPQMDVFSAGLMLAEMLAGRPLLRERDVMAALMRVQEQDLTLPEDTVVDDVLRTIVQRALARDLALRYEHAGALRDALSAWLKGTVVQEAPASAGHGTVDFLLRRMRHKADFPALGSSVARIQQAATSESESLSSLTSEILRDVALTNKLLRMVNSAHFSHAGGGSITTVSRAVALIGFAGVRNMALSLVLLEHMQDKGHASQMREEFLRALMAGTLAAGLAAMAREGEEVFIGAMFQNLGRMLTEYYFPEEAQQIRRQARDASGPAIEAAAVRVLGIGFEELGVGIAKSWGLPELLQRCMRVPDTDPPSRPVERGLERMRWLGRSANALADVLLLADPAERARSLESHASTYAPALGVSAKEILAAATSAQVKLGEFARTMGIHVGPTSPARRLFGEARETAAGPDTAAPDAATLVLEAAGPALDPGAVSDLLTAGIHSVTSSLAGDDFRLNEVLRMVLDTMQKALGARRIVFCLRDPRTDCLTGRFGLGEDVDRVCKAFKVPLDALGAKGVDLFGAICRKGADTLIADATSGTVGSRLPPWFRQEVAAPWFLLLPLTMRNAPFGLIYADAARPNAITLGEKELSLLKTLRNQAVMAFRQAERH